MLGLTKIVSHFKYKDKFFRQFVAALVTHSQVRSHVYHSFVGEDRGETP